MHHFIRQWEADWREHRIRFETWWDFLLRTGENVYIDEQLASCERRGSLFSVTLRTRLVADDGEHSVEIKAGLANFGFSLVCNIFVDGAWVGGDHPPRPQST